MEKLLAVFLVVTVSATDSHLFRQVGLYEGDLMLAGFFPIHGKAPGSERAAVRLDHSDPDINCGAIQSEDGIQFLESLYLALDMINADTKLMRGITIGAVVFDTCDQELHALEQAMELLRFLMTRTTLDDFPFVCADNSKPSLTPDLERYQNVIGVLGGSSSGVSLHLASLLRLFEVPQVSYLSTSPDLSNENLYPYFKRVVPSDNTQVRVMVEILKEFNWTYVSVVYDDTNYGTKGFEELSKVARIQGICFAYTAKIETDSPDWGSRHYEKILADLTSPAMKSKVVILYTTGTHARQMFEAGARTGLGHKVIWVGGDAWSGRASVVNGLEFVVHKAITVQPLAFHYERFDEYLETLHPKYNNRNPWFTEFWEHHFNCTLVFTSSYIDYIEREVFHLDPGSLFSGDQPISTTMCTGDEEISKHTGYRQQPNIHFVREAAYSFAHALTSLQTDVCGEDYVGMCDGIKPENLRGTQIRDYLEDVYFMGLSGRNFSFFNRRDGPPRYSIKTYRVDIPQEFGGWMSIGNYSGVDGERGFSMEPVWQEWMKDYPPSVCSDTCGAGQVHSFLPGDDCCWICSNCSEFEIAVPIVEVCYECRSGYLPDVNQTRCEQIEETYMTHTTPWAIGAMAFATIGFAATIFVLIVFIQFRKTPVIKASGREVSYYLLGGIMLSYVSAYVFVGKPSVGICAVSRVLLGLCYSIIYAAILTKTNRISRIFNDRSKSPKKPRYTSPKSQMIIVNMIVLVEVIIVCIWLGADTPRIKYIYPTRYDNILVCDGSQDARYLIPLVFPFFLLVCCAIYAFKTRKTPDGFNETKFIGFTSYTTGLIWLAFIPLYFSTSNYVLRAFTMCVGLSLTATVALACLFVPKIYVCLCRPEKNTREAIMARSSSVTSACGTLFVDPEPKTVTTGTISAARIEGCTIPSLQLDPKKKCTLGPQTRDTRAKKETDSSIYSITPTRQSMLQSEKDDTVEALPHRVKTYQPNDNLYGSSFDPICSTLEVEINVSEPETSEPPLNTNTRRKKSVSRAETMYQPGHPVMGMKRQQNADRRLSQ